MKEVAIIGAGIFGCSAAIELERKGFHVTIFERSGEILSGASTNNHLRHHWGYHYPRSKETALESINSREDFREEYEDCIIDGFPAYYAVVKENSKSTPKQFMQFCDDLGL
ncbi:MAG: FAD-binding oxidoreductase, partial [archaeon]|nr:FAD-binding oxidoreductase [archaeon]